MQKGRSYLKEPLWSSDMDKKNKSYRGRALYAVMRSELMQGYTKAFGWILDLGLMTDQLAF